MKNETTAAVIIDTIRNTNRKQGARYSEQTKIFASKLRFASPKGFNFASKYLHLPSKNTLKGLYDKKGLDEGINMAAIKALEVCAKGMSDKERVCCMFLFLSKFI